jgi:hypothetical protein
MLLTSCQDATTLSGSQIRQIQIGITTREQLTKIIGPAQRNNRTESIWIENYSPRSWFSIATHIQSYRDLTRVVVIHFSATNILKSCDVAIRNIESSNINHYKCSDFKLRLPGLRDSVAYIVFDSPPAFYWGELGPTPLAVFGFGRLGDGRPFRRAAIYMQYAITCLIVALFLSPTLVG